jgi:hypothetical protein
MFTPHKLLKRLLLLCVVLCASLYTFVALENRPSTAINDNPILPDNAGLTADNPQVAFQSWLAEAEGAPSGSLDLSRGVALARERAVWMRDLIVHDPARALQESLSLSEWLALPEAIRPHVEQPVSSRADIDVLIACGTGSASINRVTTLEDGTRFDTYTSGNPRLAKTQLGIPVQGIRLDGVGALSPAIFHQVEGPDLEAATGLYTIANTDPTRCFATGELLGSGTVAALSGGQIFLFRDEAAMVQLENSLQELDQVAGPVGGSQALYKRDFKLDEAEAVAQASSHAWSGTARDMYVILVDFSDHPGDPLSPDTPADLDNLLNGAVSQQIYDMSDYQTYINASVNTKVYRLPDTLATYAPDVLPMHDDAVAAVVADGIDLSSYETVCVYFKNTGSITFAGYASISGSKMWINGYLDDGVFTHELGHNYGSFHAHSWDVADVPGTDPVDPAGTRSEYGDPTDIMGSGDLPEGHFHVQNKVQVGWLDGSNYTDVTVSGTYRVYRSDNPQTTGTNKGLRILKSADNYYWLGYRQLYTGYEAFGRGLYLLWQQPNVDDYPKSDLLDLTPGSVAGLPDKNDGGLALGKTYSDTTAGIHITPVARGGTFPDEYMDVTVQLGSPCIRSASR